MKAESHDVASGTDPSRRSALVTGATSGVGKAVAKAFVSEGTDVWVVGRNRTVLDNARDWAHDPTTDVRPFRVDLTDQQAVLRLAAAVRERSGDDGLDHLVHCAGIFLGDEIENFRPDDFDSLFDLHVRARALLSRELLPPLRQGEEGGIVFVNSSLGLRTTRGTGLYAGSMHALRAVADALREEVNPQGVRVTSLFLGRTATPMQEEIHREEGRRYRPERLIQPETVADVVLSALELPRDAEVTDLQLRPMQPPVSESDE